MSIFSLILPMFWSVFACADLPIFHLRGDSLDAYTSRSSGVGKQYFSALSVSVQSDAGALGGSYLKFGSGASATSQALAYEGRLNSPSTRAFTLVMRIRVANNVAQGFFASGGMHIGSNIANGFAFGYTGSGALVLRMTSTGGSLGLNNSTVSFTPTAGVWHDYAITATGDTTSGGYKVYADGNLLGSVTSSQSYESPRLQWDVLYHVIGSYIAHNPSYFDLNELALYEGVQDVTQFTFADDSVGALTGPSRTKFLKSSGVRADRWEDPGAAHVRATRPQYYVAGVLQTPSLVVPTLANTKTGVAGDGGTGTYDGSDRWSDPADENVRAGVSYKANSTTNNRTGTLNAIQTGSLEAESYYELTLEGE